MMHGMCFRLGARLCLRHTARFAAGYCDAQYAGRCRLGMRAYGYGCGPACSTIGSTGTVCNDFGDGEYYSHPAVCTQVGSNKILVDSSTTMSDYTSCPKGCNAAGTGCASGGQTCTNGAKRCNGAYVQTCVSGSWQNAASACPYGCEAGDFVTKNKLSLRSKNDLNVSEK